MKVKIKSYYSPEIDNLENYIPDDPENFSFLLILMIGPLDGIGKESFSIQVCTPEWLLSNIKKDDILFGSALFIVGEYNFKRIFEKIRHRIETCSGTNWDEIATKISRFSHWEFEDYHD